MKKILKIIVSLLLVISSIIIIFLLNHLNILPSKTSIIINTVIIIICLLFLFMIFFRKIHKIIKIIFIILTIIISTSYIFIGYNIYKTINFTKNITKEYYESINYKVLILNSNYINNLADLSGKRIGFLSNDSNKSIEYLKKEIDFEEYSYDEIGTLIGNLYEGNIDAIVLNNNYIAFLDESKIDFANDYKEIYEFNIKVKKNNNQTQNKKLTGEPFIIYISGSDSRESVYDTARSDVNIVAVVNPKTKKILLVTIPRDYYVQLHGTIGLKDKLTHAGLYGVEMSITTIEDLLDINIDRYIKTSFDTVVNTVDTIDGIDIYSDKTFKRDGCYYYEGMNHVDGKCALRFSRERNAYRTGDKHRGQNQQVVLTAIIQKLTNPKYLIRYTKILDSIDGTIVTDISYDEMTDLVKNEMTDLSSWEIESISLDGDNAMMPTYTMGSDDPRYVFIPDENTINIAKEKINDYLN